MTRIMAWNIQFFTDNKLLQTLIASHIVDAIKEVNPDILVIIEVRSGASSGIGSLITDTGGAAGVLTLWKKLGYGWWVVPPQVLNKKTKLKDGRTTYFEGIAVFFQDRDLDFIGPWIWTGEKPVSRQNVNPNTQIQNYNGEWANSLPAVPPASFGFYNYNQNNFAGQPLFTAPNSNSYLEFPWPGSRMPFLTAFWQRSAQRVIKVLSVHLEPKTRWAIWGMQDLSDINLTNEFPPQPQNNGEVHIILGDFNVNRVSRLNEYTSNLGRYGYVTLNSNDATLIRSIADVTLYYQPNNPNPFWYKRDGFNNYAALDSMLYQYYGANPGGPAQNFAVKDWVCISRPSISNSSNAYMDIPLNAIPDIDSFTAPGNYGKIRGASDHLAIVAEF